MFTKLFGKIHISDNGLVVLSDYHAHTQESRAFTAVVSDAALVTGAALYIQIDTPDDDLQRQLKDVLLYTTGTDATFELNEAPTLTTGTTAVVAISRNRAKLGFSPMVMFDDPTVISGGTVLDSINFGTGQNSAGGGSGESDKEFILARNTRYLLTLTNDDSGTEILNMRINWYE